MPKHMNLKKNLIDGNIKIETNDIVENIIKGDENYVSIAAASIIAKVTRDQIMINKIKKIINISGIKIKVMAPKIIYLLLKIMV